MALISWRYIIQRLILLVAKVTKTLKYVYRFCKFRSKIERRYLENIQYLSNKLFQSDINILMKYDLSMSVLSFL